MPAIILDGVIYTDGGSGGDGGGNANMQILTWEEYDALPDTKLTDGVQYYISDGSGEIPSIENPTAKDVSYDNSESGLEAENVQEAIDKLKTGLAILMDKLYPAEYNILQGSNFTLTGDVSRSGNITFSVSTSVNVSKSGTFYSDYFDVTYYSELELSGSLYCAANVASGAYSIGAFYLQSEDGTNIIIASGRRDAGGDAMSIPFENINLTSLSGEYRLYGSLSSNNNSIVIIGLTEAVMVS